MRKKMFWGLSGSGLVLSLAAVLMAGSQVEASAPNFSLPSSEGKTVKLSDYKGKFVVLEWYNNGCPFVHKHYDSGNMQALQERYTAKGVIWFSVASSAPGKQGSMTASEAQTDRSDKKIRSTATLLDPEGKVGRLYEAKTTPTLVVINPQGQVIYKGAIDDRPSTDPEDIAGAKNYLAQALDEALAGKPVSIPETKSYGCSVKYK